MHAPQKCELSRHHPLAACAQELDACKGRARTAVVAVDERAPAGQAVVQLRQARVLALEARDHRARLAQPPLRLLRSLRARPQLPESRHISVLMEPCQAHPK